MSSKPIGIFDSGAGGLSIWKEINTLMPNESTLYISDSKYAPYGPKGSEFIIKRAKWVLKIIKLHSSDMSFFTLF